MPAFPLGKNKRKILNKVIFNQWYNYNRKEHNHFGRFAVTMLMAMYSTLAERKLRLGFKIVSDPTEQVKADFTTTSRWFKIVFERRI
jgi:hypothetical protein